jgi:hypothetical protein
MLHLRLLAACVAFAVLVPATAGASATKQPWLRVVRASPLVLRGGAFVPGERVRLTLGVGKVRFVRTTTADANGSFTARFGLAAVDPCHGMIVVTATGSRGSRSSYRRACRSSSTAPPLS